uniref:EGF-like domain-containing protein n=1 Tax=Chromera velia CCMP2878 TaxID=1169474 RepID=A0A0G4I1I8_9ALVE|eukprot:Cvel_10171.t1-p1 / transcript=Cvel_10171.t1 / gene=Cvel_10171 / organism=Chromera_velia_CCMP2878 / gene_product=Fibrillin-2, putative / transcript_product=Fibrillin-2, putative / location=Cvel_scaffold607:20910-31478(+) / protein_length=1561 / sequence_SO=supercontig / SO=protein_coding / is_pseudo=false
MWFGNEQTGLGAGAGYGSAYESNLEIILSLPCLVTLYSYGVQPRLDQYREGSPSKLDVYGSTDRVNWEVIGGYADHINHREATTYEFPVNKTAAYSNFKFDIRKISEETDNYACIGEFELFAYNWTDIDECADSRHNCHPNATCTNTDSSFLCSCDLAFYGTGVNCTALIRLSPADIGAGDQWTQDLSLTYNGLISLFYDYAGAQSGCTGRFRVRTNVEWFDYDGTSCTYKSWDWPISGLFDNRPGQTGQRSGWVTSVSQPGSGTSTPGDADVHHILELPCRAYLSAYAMEARTGNAAEQTASKATVFGSESLSGPWSELGSFDGQRSWALGERRTFPANSTLGPFAFFKFALLQRDDPSDGPMSLGEIVLFASKIASDVDECALGSHNCDPQANCTNTDGSFTCACNGALDGNGVVCGFQIPPPDIGRGDEQIFTWTKDNETLFNGVVTIYKNYTGSLCPGEYRIFSPESRRNNPGLITTVDDTEWLVSSLFDGSRAARPYCTANQISGPLDAADSEESVILGTPCYLTLAGYNWETRTNGNETSPSAMNVSGANSTAGPWMTLHSFSGVNDWVKMETKTWPVDDRATAFRFFRFTMRRVQGLEGNSDYTCGEVANLYASSVTEIPADIDECALASHNCDPQANCTNTDGSFTCACNGGLEGDGIACGFMIPPEDIGRGDNLEFTWTKDNETLFNGVVTIYKDYTGSLCPGQYRVFSPDGWRNNPGLSTAIDPQEWLVSSLFDGSDDLGRGYSSPCGIASPSDPTESEIHVILGTPCYITVAGYAWSIQTATTDFAPSAMNVSAANSTAGPWTTLHSFTGVMDWVAGAERTFPVDVREGAYRFFRFTIRRVVGNTGSGLRVSGRRAFFYATSVTDVDECADFSHNCHPNATCSDTTGSFLCSCNSGFNGTGVNCTASDGCSLRTHNCDPKATCTPTGGSFTCACNGGLEGDGVVCGFQIPPADIGRGDEQVFTWTKDNETLFNGVVTIYKDYTGSLCPGQYRVFAPDSWRNNPSLTTTSVSISEWLVSSLFDGRISGRPYCTANPVSGPSDPTESDVNVILGTPCYLTLAGYDWTSTSDASFAPSAMTLSGANSTSGPWTTLHSFAGVMDWVSGGTKTFSVDVREDAFRFFRFTIRRVVGNAGVSGRARGEMAFFYATRVTDVDECAESSHNCHSDAECNNTNGSFVCSCNTGFNGTGVNCADVDECLLSTHDCDANAQCLNTDGSFSCLCFSPFVGTGTECAEAAAFALLDSKFEACIAVAPPEQQLEILTSVLEESIVNTQEFPDDDAAALALLTSLDNLGDLISELSATGETVTVETPQTLLLIKTFDESSSSFFVESDSAAALLELPSDFNVEDMPEQGGFEEIKPPTWTSLVGAMDRSQRHFSVETAGAEGDGRRSLSLMSTKDNPHPFAAGRTREGGFLLEGVTTFVRVQARQRREVIGSGRVPLVSLSSFGLPSSRAEGGRSGGRRRRQLQDAEKESEYATEVQQGGWQGLDIPEDLLGKGAGALRIRAKGFDTSEALRQRGVWESSWEELDLGLRGGEWIWECAQLDVQVRA